jgi:hypothetical protein
MSLLTDAQVAVFNYLAPLSYFTTAPAIPVVQDLVGDVESEIDRNLGASGQGLCLLVILVGGRDAKMQNTEKLQFGQIEMRLRVLCDPARNNTGIPALTLAEDAAELCRVFKPLNQYTMRLVSIDRVEDPAAPLALDAVFLFEGGATRTTPPSRGGNYRLSEDGTQILREDGTAAEREG